MNQKILLIIIEIISIIAWSIALIDAIKAYRERRTLLKAIFIALLCIICNLLVIGITVHQIYLSPQP